MLKNTGLTKKSYPKMKGLEIEDVMKIIKDNKMEMYIPSPESKAKITREFCLNVSALITFEFILMTTNAIVVKNYG
jgi:hypothetical protein